MVTMTKCEAEQVHRLLEDIAIHLGDHADFPNGDALSFAAERFRGRTVELDLEKMEEFKP